MARTRRRLLQAAASFLPLRMLGGVRKDFWEKDPATWTAEEKQMLLLQSPWARDGVLRLEKRKTQPSAPVTVARPGGDVPGARPSGPMASSTTTPTIPFGEEIPPPPPGSGKGEPPQFPVRVRWDSARPVHLAGGPELPAESAGFYVIRLQGMPLMRPRAKGAKSKAPAAEDANQGLLAAIKQTTRIERRDKPSIPCAHLLTGSGDASTELLLFFARGADPIALDEKEVTVSGQLGSFRFAVKFRLGDMKFGGKLEL